MRGPDEERRHLLQRGSSEPSETEKISRLRISVDGGRACAFDRTTLYYIDQGCDWNWAQLEAAVFHEESLPPPAIMALELCRQGLSYQQAKAQATQRYGYWS